MIDWNRKITKEDIEDLKKRKTMRFILTAINV